eukprot:TRINITY_DN17837_c0_g1_i1.p1 TRINITY_DN17837_c0_g1~~TRINITY_DN17837_c0_g1_i1.p1  ORF type:complete len:320 (-),score=56.32 TRINITY_DN17837_c0_g1_i1:441-1319(-)
MASRTTVSAALAALLLALPTAVNGQSYYGSPRHGGFGDFFRSSSAFDGRGGSPYYGRRGDVLDDYYGYRRCPPYEEIETSSWQRLADGRASLRVLLPGVEPANRRFSVTEGGEALNVRAARLLPPRGRACLPRGAEVSADGRYEILDKSFRVPEGLDASEATIHNRQNNIVEIRVPAAPLRRRAAAPPAPAPEQRFEGRQQEAPQARTARNTVEGPRQRAQRAPAPAPRAPRAPRGVAPAALPRRPSWLPSKPANLPSSLDIEVVEEAWPAEPKNQDAAEGWFDNRGEFQYY